MMPSAVVCSGCKRLQEDLIRLCQALKEKDVIIEKLRERDQPLVSLNSLDCHLLLQCSHPYTPVLHPPVKRMS
ncbi:hypothetical protein AAFF_G00181310 [Aldrovandia affinis]|uniref:Uncharacterized protein n=1 Tax=Aldrovandia affinis TaxID=143900 RepID=A0AAD7T0I4_9TELE|nr:hypothetical protein AAFF_G00181310 [Aldrovandia affinis]